MRLLLASAALILAAAPGFAIGQKDEVPAAVPDGKPVTCLSLSQVRESKVRDDRTIDFFTRGGKVYRNTLDMPCPQLGFEQRFSHRTTINQICSNDLITVLQSPGLSAGPSCALSQFQPVKLVGKK